MEHPHGHMAEEGEGGGDMCSSHLKNDSLSRNRPTRA